MAVARAGSADSPKTLKQAPKAAPTEASTQADAFVKTVKFTPTSDGRVSPGNGMVLLFAAQKLLEGAKKGELSGKQLDALKESLWSALPPDSGGKRDDDCTIGVFSPVNAEVNRANKLRFLAVLKQIDALRPR